ncbi:kinase-like domain-containing protein, partial [Mycena amicta]
VLKRFYNVGKGKDCVTLAENHEELQKEAQRLTQVGWFLHKFLERADATAVAIEDDLCVTECKLMCEIPKADSAPSVPSGYSAADLAEADCPMVWLMEPFRPGNTQKSSGTNQHPTHRENKLGNTLNAFAHFVYLHSYKTIVLADIQSTRARVGNKVAQVLFDLTTHTKNGNTGAGDHGLVGINTFIAQHECTPRCDALGLEALVTNGDDTAEKITE